MSLLAAVILEHTDATGRHHDLMVEDPASDAPHATDARLWTARILPPPGDWLRLEALAIEPIAYHRRAYLDYEGEISRNRGSVRRLHTGFAEAEIWLPEQKRLHLDMPGLVLTLVIRNDKTGKCIAAVSIGKKLSPKT